MESSGDQDVAPDSMGSTGEKSVHPRLGNDWSSFRERNQTSSSGFFSLVVGTVLACLGGSHDHCQVWADNSLANGTLFCWEKRPSRTSNSSVHADLDKNKLVINLGAGISRKESWDP